MAASAEAKGPSGLAKILEALGGSGNDSSRSDLIPAFSPATAAAGCSTDGTASSCATVGLLGADSYASSHGSGRQGDFHGDSTASSGVAHAAPPAQRSGLLIRPGEPIQLNVHRLLALSPSMPPSMQRPAWSSYDYNITEKLYTGYASKGAATALATPQLDLGAVIDEARYTLSAASL
jgi:hypothetical protein